MGIVFLILVSSRKRISGLFGTTGLTRMQWRAVLEQLLIVNIGGWSVDAAAPTVLSVPHSKTPRSIRRTCAAGTADASPHLPPLLLFW